MINLLGINLAPVQRTQMAAGGSYKQVLLSYEEYKALPETDPNTKYLIINEDEDDEGR